MEKLAMAILKRKLSQFFPDWIILFFLSPMYNKKAFKEAAIETDIFIRGQDRKNLIESSNKQKKYLKPNLASDKLNQP